MVLILQQNRPLSYDERAWSLEELDRLADDGKGFRRVQNIRVWRDGRLHEFSRDLGPTLQFKASPIGVMSLDMHTVGEVMDFADKIRFDSGLEQAMADHAGEYNIVEQLVTRREQLWEFVKRNPRTAKRLRKARS